VKRISKRFSKYFHKQSKGMGFGFSICRRIVDAQGGRILVESTVGKGATFRIYLVIANEKKL
jgi:signal transduction histidine kinase